MASLPEDIINHILSLLPIKSISRFRCVSKLWYDWFKNPNFIKMHRYHATKNNKFSVILQPYTDSDYTAKFVYYTIDFDVTSSSYHMVVETNRPRDTFVPGYLYTDSCDGLICLFDGNHNGESISLICLWNPSTREYKKIPLPTSFSQTNYDFFSSYGVCYDWKFDDYKLFKLVVGNEARNTCCEIWVRRLSSNSWENIGKTTYDVCRSGKVCVKPLNGIIHWIGGTKVIVSLDIVEERSKEIQIPSCCYLDDELYSYHDMEVHVLGDDLYLSVNAAYKERNIDLWVMKVYGVIHSWTKIFSLSNDETNFGLLWPLHYLNKNGEILLHAFVRLEDEYSGEDALVSYDPINREFVTLDIPRIPKHFSAITFDGSLVSVNSGEFVEATTTSKGAVTQIGNPRI